MVGFLAFNLTFNDVGGGWWGYMKGSIVALEVLSMLLLFDVIANISISGSLEKVVDTGEPSMMAMMAFIAVLLSNAFILFYILLGGWGFLG